jgi:hypothetical protein
VFICGSFVGGRGRFGVDRALGLRQQRLVKRPLPPVRECLFLVLDFVARQQTDGLSVLVLLLRRQPLEQPGLWHPRPSPLRAFQAFLLRR